MAWGIFSTYVLFCTLLSFYIFFTTIRFTRHSNLKVLSICMQFSILSFITIPILMGYLLFGTDLFFTVTLSDYQILHIATITLLLTFEIKVLHLFFSAKVRSSAFSSIHKLPVVAIIFSSIVLASFLMKSSFFVNAAFNFGYLYIVNEYDASEVPVSIRYASSSAPALIVYFLVSRVNYRFVRFLRFLSYISAFSLLFVGFRGRFFSIFFAKILSVFSIERRLPFSYIFAALFLVMVLFVLGFIREGSELKFEQAAISLLEPVSTSVAAAPNIADSSTRSLTPALQGFALFTGASEPRTSSEITSVVAPWISQYGYAISASPLSEGALFFGYFGMYLAPVILIFLLFFITSLLSLYPNNFLISILFCALLFNSIVFVRNEFLFIFSEMAKVFASAVPLYLSCTVIVGIIPKRHRKN